MDTDARKNWARVLFYLGLSLLVAHELDAIVRHEWRLLPGFNFLDDMTGQTVFVLLHIPAFAATFYFVSHQSEVISNRSQILLDTFLIVHAVIHYAMSGHVLYEFEGPVEFITVYGAGLIGLAHVAWMYRGR